MSDLVAPRVTVELENGVVDIPGIEVPPRGRPCRLQVILDAIYYSDSGDDIGSDWRFDAVVRGAVWTSGRITLQRGTTLPVNQTIVDYTSPSGCGMAQVLDFLTRAREYDVVRDDVGQRVDVTSIGCKPEEQRRPFLMLVPVAETPEWRWIFAQRPRVALILYFFTIKAACV